jgi:hypothetical protein
MATKTQLEQNGSRFFKKTNNNFDKNFLLQAKESKLFEKTSSIKQACSIAELQRFSNFVYKSTTNLSEESLELKPELKPSKRTTHIILNKDNNSGTTPLQESEIDTPLYPINKKPRLPLTNLIQELFI